jgi:hypothetical protein
MKERPILFSAPMVRALLDGSKTQTRRELKYPWDVFNHKPIYRCGPDGGEFRPNAAVPYGQPGDRLWVRETLACTDHHGVWYDADTDGFNNRITDERSYGLAERYGHPYFATEVRRIPSIHMPRWASRILLEVVNVRVERLQDISEKDAQAEGIKADEVRQITLFGATADERAAIYRRAAVRPYQELWESINGAGSWDANPWVWVVEFKRVGD